MGARRRRRAGIDPSPMNTAPAAWARGAPAGRTVTGRRRTCPAARRWPRMRATSRRSADHVAVATSPSRRASPGQRTRRAGQSGGSSSHSGGTLLARAADWRDAGTASVLPRRAPGQACAAPGVPDRRRGGQSARMCPAGAPGERPASRRARASGEPWKRTTCGARRRAHVAASPSAATRAAAAIHRQAKML